MAGFTLVVRLPASTWLGVATITESSAFTVKTAHLSILLRSAKG